MPYTDNVPHAGSAELLTTGMYQEPAGTIAVSMPRAMFSSSTLTPWNTTGQVGIRGIALPAGMVVTNIAVYIGNTGATGPTHWWFALTDPQLNVLAVTADQLSAAVANNAFLKVPLLTPFQVQYTALYYVPASFTASTTAPTGLGGGAVGGAMTPAPVLAGTAGTQSLPPAVGAQLNGGVISATTAGNFGVALS